MSPRSLDVVHSLFVVCRASVHILQDRLQAVTQRIDMLNAKVARRRRPASGVDAAAAPDPEARRHAGTHTDADAGADADSLTDTDADTIADADSIAAADTGSAAAGAAGPEAVQAGKALPHTSTSSGVAHAKMMASVARSWYSDNVPWYRNHIPDSEGSRRASRPQTAGSSGTASSRRSRVDSAAQRHHVPPLRLSRPSTPSTGPRPATASMRTTASTATAASVQAAARSELARAHTQRLQASTERQRLQLLAKQAAHKSRHPHKALDKHPRPHQQSRRSRPAKPHPSPTSLLNSSGLTLPTTSVAPAADMYLDVDPRRRPWNHALEAFHTVQSCSFSPPGRQATRQPLLVVPDQRRGRTACTKTLSGLLPMPGGSASPERRGKFGTLKTMSVHSQTRDMMWK